MTIPRVPDELLSARLPAPALRVWLAVRKRQGDNEWAWHPAVEYARMAAVKEKDVYAILALLAEWGWLEKGTGKQLACLVGRPYTAGKRGGKRKTTTPKERAKTTPKEGGTPDYPQRRGTTTPKEGGQTTPKEGTHTNPERIQKESRKDSPLPPVSDSSLPDWLDVELWEAFKRHRREKKSALTPTAESRALVKLTKIHEAGRDPNAALDHSLANGWTGIYEPDPPAQQGRGSGKVGSAGAAHGEAAIVSGRSGPVPPPDRNHADERRKSASDRRSDYGYDDAHRDVQRALAPLIATDDRGGSGADDDGGDDG